MKIFRVHSGKTRGTHAAIPPSDALCRRRTHKHTVLTVPRPIPILGACLSQLPVLMRLDDVTEACSPWFQATTLDQVGSAPCVFSTLFFVQSPTLRTTSRAFLPCVFWLGLLGGIHRRSGSWRRVILGYLFLAGFATGWLHPFTERHNSCQHPLQFQKRFSPDLGVVMGLQYCQP